MGSTSCMKIANILVTLLVIFFSFCSASDSNADSICKSAIKIYGYPCEEHTVTTRDGYILSLQRIPGSRSGESATEHPVLVQHGISCNGASWVVSSPAESLGFMLADSGYDVWLANTRGTAQSIKHKWLSSSDPAYWEWSWDELAKYDLAAFVQYVYGTTGNKMHYVGHSLGTLMALAAFSKQYKLLTNLRSAALLSPIAYLNHISSLPLKLAASAYVGEALYGLGVREIPPGQDQMSVVIGIACKIPFFCSSLMPAVAGSKCVDSSKADLFFQNFPQPTSTKNMIQLSQMIRTGTITMYDYGNKGANLDHYNQATPPAYNMTNIPKDFPLFIGYGGDDQLADAQDVKILLNTLKGHDADKLVVKYVKEFAHMDFVLCTTANQAVYNPLISFFQVQDGTLLQTPGFVGRSAE